MARNDLTVDRLRDLLNYDPHAGLFTWRLGRPKCKAGSVAGGISSHGYWRIGINGAQHYAHRLAWLYMTGKWPSEHTDHIDGDKLNNRFANLRDVPELVNHQNKRQPQKNNKCGALGVSWCTRSRKWRAQIKGPGDKNRFLGAFENVADAQRAYIDAKRRIHEGCTI